MNKNLPEKITIVDKETGESSNLFVKVGFLLGRYSDVGFEVYQDEDGNLRGKATHDSNLTKIFRNLFGGKE